MSPVYLLPICPAAQRDRLDEDVFCDQLEASVLGLVPADERERPRVASERGPIDERVKQHASGSDLLQRPDTSEYEAILAPVGAADEYTPGTIARLEADHSPMRELRRTYRADAVIAHATPRVVAV